MRAFAISYYGRRYLGLMPNPPEGVAEATNHGWRPFRYVKDVADAEKFGSREAAELFCRGLKGSDHRVVELSSGGRGMAA